MQNILNRENFGLNLTRRLRDPVWQHVLATSFVTDKTILSSKDNSYFFPLYLYPAGGLRENLFDQEVNKIPSFTAKFLRAIKGHVGDERNPEGIFPYIYAVLHSPTYRERYQEFLRIDFARVPREIDRVYLRLTGCV